MLNISLSVVWPALAKRTPNLKFTAPCKVREGGGASIMIRYGEKFRDKFSGVSRIWGREVVDHVQIYNVM